MMAFPSGLHVNGMLLFSSKVNCRVARSCLPSEVRLETRTWLCQLFRRNSNVFPSMPELMFLTHPVPRVIRAGSLEFCGDSRICTAHKLESAGLDSSWR